MLTFCYGLVLIPHDAHGLVLYLSIHILDLFQVFFITFISCSWVKCFEHFILVVPFLSKTRLTYVIHMLVGFLFHMLSIYMLNSFSFMV
jgi:hypothetical protein